MRCGKFFVMMAAVLICPAASFAQSVLHDQRDAQPTVKRPSKNEGERFLRTDTLAHAIPHRVVFDRGMTFEPRWQDNGMPADSSLHIGIGLPYETLKTTSILNGNAAAERQLDVPDGVGWRSFGSMAFDGFIFTGVREREEHPHLLTIQRLNLVSTYQTGPLSFTAGVNVNRYYALGVTTQYGAHGALTYSFSPYLSMTAFGEYESSNPWFYMAAFPYVGTSRYGGYLTYQNNRLGTHVGAEKYYDPFVRRWVLRPIVTPFIQVSNKFRFELPLGGMLKAFADHLFHANRPKGPIVPPRR
jgi:hypothetical protein